MQVLVLTSAVRAPDNHQLWAGLGNHCRVDLRRLSSEQQKHLRDCFAGIDVAAYDWVILDLLFKRISTQAGFLRGLPRLILYEEDACQEFLPQSRWRGKFSGFYRKLPQARVIMTGYAIAERFRAMGVDARFLPKGYDSTQLFDQGGERDVELGFIGRLASAAYSERRAFLERAVATFGLAVMRTEPGVAYRAALNRIAVFVSADVGLGEYMAKNFEAMACGCLLLAYRQGGGEEAALGLEDDRNVLLYGDFEEFAAKIAMLRSDPARCRTLAARGKAHAAAFFDYYRQAERLYAFLQDAPRRPEIPCREPWPVRLRAACRRLLRSGGAA